MKINKVCILGMGYIGLPTASVFATHGLKVAGVDINPEVLSTLRKGEIHIHEPGLKENLKAALQTGNLTIHDTPVEADAFIIAVPTPFFEDKFGEHDGKRYRLADMRAVRSAAESIVPILKQGNLVILESTSPPRTTIDMLSPILERSGMKAGLDFHLAYSPERVLPGKILMELIENARVIGGVNLASAEAGRDLYSTFVNGEIVLTNATTAEMVKLMENTYRDVNIAIANEFSRLAEKYEVDVWEAIRIANLHPRVKILSPGPGVGGHCISVDPWFFVESAPDLSNLIYEARRVNDTQPKFVLDLVKKSIGNLQGKKIAALGLAYKPDVDDLRESPAVEVVNLLQRAGANITTFEPFKPNANLPGIKTASSLNSAVKDAEVLILLVNHTILCSLTPEELAGMTHARVLVDTVNGWIGNDWASAGFKLYRLGTRIK